jgi:hypothetical protein
MRPYSIAVAALSSFKNLIIRRIPVAPLRRPSIFRFGILPGN